MMEISRKIIKTRLYNTLVVIGLLMSTFSFSAPVNITTRGYALGQLTKVDTVGNLGKVLEARLLLGRDSEEVKPSELRSNSIRDVRNPFVFCADQEWLASMDDLLGNYVVVSYKSTKSSRLISCSGRYELVDMYRRQTSDLTATSFSLFNRKPATVGLAESGIIVGRVVTAFESGKRGNKWFAVIQEGVSGNDFQRMNIENEDLFLFAVETLRRAQKSKIYHYKKFNNSPIDRYAEHYIWKITVLNDL